MQGKGLLWILAAGPAMASGKPAKRANNAKQPQGLVKSCKQQMWLLQRCTWVLCGVSVMRSRLH